MQPLLPCQVERKSLCKGIGSASYSFGICLLASRFPLQSGAGVQGTCDISINSTVWDAPAEDTEWVPQEAFQALPSCGLPLLRSK